MKKPLVDRIEELRQRQLQGAARLAALQAKAKTVERKQDTRRKIVVGAAVLSEMERMPQFATYVRQMLNKAVTRPQDRETIAHLLTPPAAPIATTEAGEGGIEEPRMAG